MLKKLLFVGGGLLLLSGLFFGRDACSYLSTTMGWVHDSVKDSVPIQFEIDRARRMIRGLDPEIERNMRKIATEEVDAKKLRDQLERSEQHLAKSQQDILRLTNDLKRGGGDYVYASVTYTANQVKRDLERRFERFKVKEATVEKLRNILNARQRGLAAAQEKLKEMRAAQRQLEVDVENLEARQKMVEVAQTSSDFRFDDSRLSRTKELIEAISTRIDVAEKLVNAQTEYPDQIQLDEPASANILEEVAQHFGLEPSVEQTVQLD
jgi:Skp family chaperone for outer membrane proteins